MLGKVVGLLRWAPLGWLKAADPPTISERFVETQARLAKEMIPQLAARGWDDTTVFRKHVNPVLGKLQPQTERSGGPTAALEVQIRDSIRAYLIGGC